MLGLDEALEEFGRQNVPGVLGDTRGGPGQRWPGIDAVVGLAGEGAPSGMRLSPEPPSLDDEPDRESGPSPAVEAEAIDAAIESQWGEDALPPGLVRSAGRPHRDNPPEPPLREGGTNRRDTEVSRSIAEDPPSLRQPSMDEGRLASAALVIALMVHHWPDRQRLARQPRLDVIGNKVFQWFASRFSRKNRCF